MLTRFAFLLMGGCAMPLRHALWSRRGPKVTVRVQVPRVTVQAQRPTAQPSRPSVQPSQVNPSHGSVNSKPTGGQAVTYNTVKADMSAKKINTSKTIVTARKSSINFVALSYPFFGP